jgi:hypothetical protein
MIYMSYDYTPLQYDNFLIYNFQYVKELVYFIKVDC